MDCVVLEELIEPNYEPTQNEIEEYAEWLGMDPHSEKHFLWIAKEGLKVRKTRDRWWRRRQKRDDSHIFTSGTTTKELETM